MQSGIKRCREKGKVSAMKEIWNLTIKNDCFREVEYESLTPAMKDKALPMLMFIVMKQNGDLKSRSYVNGSFQWVYIDKHEVLLPTLDFYSLKYACGVAAQEEYDIAIVDLLGFFLQTEADENAELVILKLTGIVALLFVESNEAR
jgi:hypothetical protein